MTKLCSVIFPSRARAEQCEYSVRSLLLAEPGVEGEFDVLIRLDNDDPQKERYRELLSEIPNVRLIFGERGKGYGELWKFYDELAKATDSKWLMQWNDDASLFGPWITELKKVPVTGIWVQCEIHRLGGSTYPQDDGAPFVILPNRFWEVIGLDRIPHYTDTGSINALRAIGWKCHFLPGTSFHHERDSSEVLADHRRL